VLKGTATFRDESIAPPVQAGLHDLTGTVKGLSSKQMARAEVNLSGKIDKVAPLKVAGTINPLTEDTFTDLTIRFDNVDLTTAAPYTGKYVGYPIRKGKLFLDLVYKVSQKQLEAENKVAVDQLTFGEKTDSPDATSLPVPLAIALLKDRQGRIDIDLPIRGDLKDPDFRYGKAVWATLGNLLTKMVASPFALMGKLVPGGGDGEELQHLAFQPGSTTLDPKEQKKIDALMKGMEERPGLRLEITGTADPARDREALALQRLEEQLRARWRNKSGDAKNGDKPSPTDEERLIRELYDHRRSQQPPAPQKAEPPTVEEMKRELLATMNVEEDALRTLARTRAEQVHEQLVGEGKLSDERVFLTDVDLAPSEDHEKVQSRLNITAGS
jgi:outer membrane protein OmpA-like peptidoglycan-associated protein